MKGGAQMNATKREREKKNSTYRLLNFLAGLLSSTATIEISS